MADSYPAELPAMASGGWPTVISNLEVRDASGQLLATSRAGQAGWRLEHSASGQIHLRYVADFGVFQEAGWSSPRESAVADEDTIAVCARGLFIVTDRVANAGITFVAPAPWRAVAPWPQRAAAGEHEARGVNDLLDNFLVLSRGKPDLAATGGFRLQVTAMGHWRPLRPLIRHVLRTVVSRQVSLMGFSGTEAFNVILVPTPETGGEAYRQSLLLANDMPSRANVSLWGNTIAHELFHYWNGARLRGSDYANSQWFQEGFTEYVANLTLLNGKIFTPTAFLAKLSNHVTNYRRLTTTLEDIGTRKGPPLYSAGALVAFSFDTSIRMASGGTRDIGSFFRALWQRTGAGARTYAWPDIEAALAATASADWRGYYLRHIRGHEPLPLERAFREVGLRLDEAADGAPRVSVDMSAPASARRSWQQLING